MFKKLFDAIETQKEASRERERLRLEAFENKTPGIKVIADTIVEAIVDPTSGVVQNMRNNVFAQYLYFTKYGMKHIVRATNGVDAKEAAEETPYNFTFAELGKNPLDQRDVENFRDLIKMKLNDYPWMKATNGGILINNIDKSLTIEKSNKAEIPETFWGNDIKF